MDSAANKSRPEPRVSIFAKIVVPGDDGDQTYYVNYSDQSTKQWFTRLMVWALTNGRKVTISAVGAQELMNVRLFTPPTRGQ